jgi:hypothetical protein
MNNIKKIIILSTFAALISGALPAGAETPVGNEVFGIGLQLGDPAGLTIKILPTEVFGFQAFVGGGGWHANYYYNAMFITGIDVIFHPVTFHEWNTCALNLTLGAGAALGVFRGWYDGNPANYPYSYYYYDGQTYATMFIKFVTGVNLWFKKFPLEVFVELSPSIQLFRPDPVAFHMFWTVAGARWWF